MNVDEVADLAVAAVLVVTAAATLARAYSRPTGVLVAVVAATWIGGLWVPALLWTHRGALVYLVFAFMALVPRPKAFLPVTVVVAMASAVPALAIDERFTMILAVTVLAGAIVRFIVTPRMDRAPVGAALASATLFAMALITPIALRSLGDAPTEALVIYCACVALAVIVLGVYAMRSRPHEVALTNLIVELADATDAGTLRTRLVQALGDPSLRIGYVGETDQVFDEQGHPLLDDGRQARTPIHVAGRPVAVLLHDPALRVDGRLAESIAAVMDLAIRNVRMDIDVRARARAIAESRERLLRAEDAARRDVERALRNGPRRRLERVAGLVGGIGDPESGRDLLDAVDRATADLRRFGLGLLPAAALESDLAHTLEGLAHDFPFRVDLDLDGLTGPLPEACRPTIWFVCAEAVTNAAKYAAPEQVAVSVSSDDTGLTVTVTDDGRGGARMGSGLRGLADRAEALGGTLELSSRAGAGTTVRVRLPALPATEPAR